MAVLLNPYLSLHERLSREPSELQLELRKGLIWAYSWALPSEEAARALAELSPIVEVGAGTGYWAWLIGQAGGRVRAVDRNVTSPRWVEVMEGDANAAAGSERCLFLCWPSLDENVGLDALRAFRGSHVAYVGEWRGRTGSAAFHDELERAWVKVREIAIPTWPGFQDRLFIFERRERRIT